MKKSFTVIFILCVMISTVVLSQTWTPNEYSYRAGVSFPAAPQRFYDYWKTGFGIGGGIGFPVTTTVSFLLSGEYARFSLDKDRFFKGIHLSSDGNSISGATTNIVGFSGVYRYFPERQPQPIPIYFIGGGAIVLSSVGSSSANYSGYTVSQGGEFYFVVSAVAGGGLLFTINPTTSWYIEGEYYFGLLRSAHANSNFTQLSIGIRELL